MKKKIILFLIFIITIKMLNASLLDPKKLTSEEEYWSKKADEVNKIFNDAGWKDGDEEIQLYKKARLDFDTIDFSKVYLSLKWGLYSQYANSYIAEKNYAKADSIYYLYLVEFAKDMEALSDEDKNSYYYKNYFIINVWNAQSELGSFVCVFLVKYERKYDLARELNERYMEYLYPEYTPQIRSSARDDLDKYINDYKEKMKIADREMEKILVLLEKWKKAFIGMDFDLLQSTFSKESDTYKMIEEAKGNYDKS